MLKGLMDTGAGPLHNGYLGMEAVELGSGTGQETLFLSGCEQKPHYHLRAGKIGK